MIRIFLIAFCSIMYIQLQSQTVRDSLNPVHLDTVTVKPMLSWDSFKDSFINMAAEEKIDLFRYYPPPPESDKRLENLIPVFEIQPGVHMLMLPYSLDGAGLSVNMAISIDMLYDITTKRTRKKKPSKVLPKFD